MTWCSNLTLAQPPKKDGNYSSYITHCTVNNATKSGFVPSVSHIPVRVSERLDFSKWMVPRNESSAVCTRNLHNLITIPTVPDQANVPHKLGLSEYSQGRHIPTRLTTARNDSRRKTHQSRKGGGVGILLIKEGFRHKRKYPLKFRAMEYLDLSLTLNELKFRLVAVYRPSTFQEEQARHIHIFQVNFQPY